MRNETLLAFLAAKVTNKPENMATEALCFILRSGEARRSIQRLLGRFGLVSQVERYETQVQADDDTRPDLVGFDAENHESVFIECKFWAGLTAHQPAGYLRRLPEVRPSMLVFVCPEMRMQSLWVELIQRVKEAFKVVEEDAGGCRLLIIDKRHRMVLVSWRDLLREMETDLETGGKAAAASDVRQLQGLAERMDTEAFLPLRPDELAPEIPRRLLHLSELVNKAADAAIKEDIFSNKTPKGGKLTAGTGQNYYGRYLGFGDTYGMLMLDLWAWAYMGPSPIWFAFYGVNWDGKKYLKAFEPLKTTVPPRLYTEEGDSPYVPIILPCGVEEDAVVRSMVEQLREIRQLLERWQPST